MYSPSVKFGSIVTIVKRYGMLLVAGTLLISLVKNVTRIQKAGERIGDAQSRLKVVKEENKRLASELKEVQSEAYVEKQAHDKLGLAKEGEVVLVLPEEEILRNFSPRREALPEDELPDPIWRRWLKLFV